jgi:hypothetical protein
MADHNTSDFQKRHMDVCATFVADSQTAELMQPTDRSFHHPAADPQAASMFRVSLGDDRLDASLGQLIPVRFGIVRSVGEHFLGTIHRAAHLPGDGRNGVHQWDQLRDIVAVGPREVNGKRNAFRIRDEVMFRAVFPAVHGTGTGIFAPPTARTWELSTTAADRSSCSLPRNRSSKTLWILSHTPACCHASRYRQQLMPEPHPISWGKSSQGMPLLSTKRMPVSTLRRSRGFRPGYFVRRGLDGGNSGSIRFHSSSSNNGFAMSGPPCPFMTSASKIHLHESFC